MREREQDMPVSSSISEYTHDRGEIFPFNFDITAANSYTYVPRESVMSNADCARYWDLMFNKWYLFSDTEKTVQVNNVIVYFITNGSSPRGNYTGFFTVGGRKLKVSVIREVLGDQVRKFARAHADMAKEILDNHEPLRRRQAVEYGFTTSMGNVAFDFADYCSGLSHDQMKAIRVAKRRMIAGSLPYDSNNVGIGPTNSKNSGAVGDDEDV